MKSLIRYRDLVLPISMIGCLVVILVPLPTAVLDLLIAGNITIAVVMFLTTMYVAKPLDFSVFPTLLLATTLARLVLNVATTRLILTGAERNGSGAAGQMIESFGTFVAGDQVEVGLVIFVILIVIQFVVITKGATRISEVAARFALDGMPGRQMAVDSDFNAGVINEETARRRREEISEQADFYGTMDGASKFVRGDAIAAVIITVVNIIGGLYVGMVHLGMSLTSAASMFTKLTIGDGLVSQIPALLISLSAGFGDPKYQTNQSPRPAFATTPRQFPCFIHCRWFSPDTGDYKPACRSSSKPWYRVYWHCISARETTKDSFRRGKCTNFGD